MRFMAWLLPLAVILALLVALASCYSPHNPPPCRPGSVDYPSCNPTRPALTWPDAGQG